MGAKPDPGYADGLTQAVMVSADWRLTLDDDATLTNVLDSALKLKACPVCPDANPVPADNVPLLMPWTSLALPSAGHQLTSAASAPSGRPVTTSDTSAVRISHNAARFAARLRRADTETTSAAPPRTTPMADLPSKGAKIGRASCRESGERPA